MWKQVRFLQTEIDVLDHGHVHLIAALADDLDVVNAARVSFNQVVETMEERDEGLIRFLVREQHGTPFEHGFFKFRIKAPIFVFREWHRHRVGHSYNEWSGRYSKLEPEFYVPEILVTQTGKPGAYTFEEHSDLDQPHWREWIKRRYDCAFEAYEQMLDAGIAKQQARIVLPLATYSEMIWSCNPRSLMHFLSLRNSDQAQYEIREYARVVEDFFSEAMPVTHDAFVANGRKAP